MTLRTLNYGNGGIFLIMGNAGFCPSTVVLEIRVPCRVLLSRLPDYLGELYRDPTDCPYRGILSGSDGLVLNERVVESLGSQEGSSQ